MKFLKFGAYGSLDTSVLPSEYLQMKASLQTGCCANIGFRCALMPSYLWRHHFSDFGHIRFFQGHEWDRSTVEFRNIWEDFSRPWSCCSSFKCFTLNFFSSLVLILPLSHLLSHIVSPFTPTMYFCLSLWHFILTKLNISSALKKIKKIEKQCIIN